MMTTDEMRVAIFGAMGFTDAIEGGIGNGWYRRNPTTAETKSVPELTLDWMHEAEKVLPTGDNCDGCGTSSLDYYDSKISRRATAAQRAEAFLKTLNLWKP